MFLRLLWSQERFSSAVKYSMPLSLVIFLLLTLISVTASSSLADNMLSLFVSNCFTYSRNAESGKFVALISTSANACEVVSERMINDNRNKSALVARGSWLVARDCTGIAIHLSSTPFKILLGYLYYYRQSLRRV